MTYPLIQWSNHSDKPNGFGRVRTPEDKIVHSQKGYIPQALDIANSPADFSDRDLMKAAAILTSRKLYGLSRSCSRMVLVRQEAADAAIHNTK